MERLAGRRLLPRASGRPAGRAAAAALCVGPALPRHAARGRLGCRGEDMRRWHGLVTLATSRSRVRSTPPSAAASPPPSPSLPASRLPVKRAVVAQLPGQTGHTGGRLASWHAGKYQAQALSAARPDGTPHRASRRRRQSFGCGRWHSKVSLRCVALWCYYGVGPQGAAGLQGMPAARPRPRAGDRTS